MEEELSQIQLEQGQRTELLADIGNNHTTFFSCLDRKVEGYLKQDGNMMKVYTAGVPGDDRVFYMKRLELPVSDLKAHTKSFTPLGNANTQMHETFLMDCRSCCIAVTDIPISRAGGGQG